MTSPDPTLERSLKGHKNTVTSVAFHPGGKYIASGSKDHDVICYYMKPGMRALRFAGHQAAVHSVDFHPTDPLLASGSSDNTIKLWTTSVRGDVTTFKAHVNTVRSVTFSHDGETILSSSDDKSIKLWNAQKTRFLYSLTGHVNWVRCAKFSPDSRLVVSGSDDKVVKLWDTRSKECVETFLEHTGLITCVAFHPSGNLIGSTSSDRSVKIWDLRYKRLLQNYPNAHGNKEGAAGTVTSLDFGGKSGEWMITTGGDGLVKVWDIQEGHLFYTLYGHKNGATTSAVFSKDDCGGKRFASAGEDAQILLWNASFNNIDNNENFPGTKQSTVHDEFVNKIKGNAPTKSSPEKKVVNDIGELIVNRESLKNAAKTSISPKKTKNVTPVPAAATTYSETTELTKTLQQLVTQIDILTQTMLIMEERLSKVEETVLNRVDNSGDHEIDLSTLE